MSEGAAGQKLLPKPQLRGLFRRFTGRMFLSNLVICTAVGLYCWFPVMKRRDRVYSEFYDNYTEEAAMRDFEDMRRVGVFKSAPRDGEEMEEW